MSTPVPKFDCSADDLRLISKIVDRVHALFTDLNPQARRNTFMDLVAVHRNGCPLALEALLASDIGDLAHDVGGIATHIDRKTGSLQDGFLPRYRAQTPDGGDKYHTARLLQSSVPQPLGEVVAYIEHHPMQASGHSLPVVRTRVGREVAWTGATVRSLPGDWRRLVPWVEVVVRPKTEVGS